MLTVSVCHGKGNINIGPADAVRHPLCSKSLRQFRRRHSFDLEMADIGVCRFTPFRRFCTGKVRGVLVDRQGHAVVFTWKMALRQLPADPLAHAVYE